MLQKHVLAGTAFSIAGVVMSMMVACHAIPTAANIGAKSRASQLSAPNDCPSYVNDNDHYDFCLRLTPNFTAHIETEGNKATNSVDNIQDPLPFSAPLSDIFYLSGNKTDVNCFINRAGSTSIKINGNSIEGGQSNNNTEMPVDLRDNIEIDGQGNSGIGVIAVRCGRPGTAGQAYAIVFASAKSHKDTYAN